jgi:cytochrome P450
MRVVAGRSRSSKTGLTASQIIQQIPVLLIAGQETSVDLLLVFWWSSTNSSANQAAVLLFALYWLSQNSEFQQNLRQEIMSKRINSQEDGLEYDNMPLLNALIKVNS